MSHLSTIEENKTMLTNIVNESRWYLRSSVAQKSSLPSPGSWKWLSFFWVFKKSKCLQKIHKIYGSDDRAKHIPTPHFKEMACDALLIQADIHHFLQPVQTPFLFLKLHEAIKQMSQTRKSQGCVLTLKSNLHCIRLKYIFRNLFLSLALFSSFQKLAEI